MSKRFLKAMTVLILFADTLLIFTGVAAMLLRFSILLSSVLIIFGSVLAILDIKTLNWLISKNSDK